ASFSPRPFYSGNGNYPGKPPSCDPSKAGISPLPYTTLFRSGQGGLVDNAHPAALGAAVHDTSTLGGSVGGFPLGGASDPATVTYEFFTTNDCTGSHTDQTVNVAADGSVPNADPQTLGAGSYSYLAVYSGNGNYTGKTAACEP